MNKFIESNETFIMVGPTEEDTLCQNGAVVDSVSLSADEMNGAGGADRTKILKDLVKDNRKIFRMVITVAITIILTSYIIHHKSEEYPLALKRQIDKFTGYLENVSDIEIKCQRYKTKLNGQMLALPQYLRVERQKKQTLNWQMLAMPQLIMIERQNNCKKHGMGRC